MNFYTFKPATDVAYRDPISQLEGPEQNLLQANYVGDYKLQNMNAEVPS